jgi:cytochrome c oxidase subunit 2
MRAVLRRPACEDVAPRLCTARDEFERWIQQQSQPAQTTGTISDGRRVFERLSCINCHTVAGTVANGTFGPDLTHLMSRETLAAGAVANTPENLRRWIRDPSVIKPACKMPAMGLSDPDVNAVTEYLETLR